MSAALVLIFTAAVTNIKPKDGAKPLWLEGVALPLFVGSVGKSASDEMAMPKPLGVSVSVLINTMIWFFIISGVQKQVK